MSLKNVIEGTCCEYSLKWISQSPRSPALVSGSNFHVFILAGLVAKLGSRSSFSYSRKQGVTVIRKMSVVLL